MRTSADSCVEVALFQYARIASDPTAGSRKGLERYSASSVKSSTTALASFSRHALP